MGLRNQLGIVDDFWETGGCSASLRTLLDSCPDHYEPVNVTAQEFRTGLDLYLVNNFRSFSLEQIEYLISQPHVCWWHDVLPVPYPELVAELARTAKINYFMSPLHQMVFLQKYRMAHLSDIPVALLPAMVNAEQFPPTKKTKPEAICWVGSIFPHKGIEQVLLWARQAGKIVDFYGTGDPLLVQQLKYSRYADYQGEVPEDELPNVFSFYGTFIHLPLEVEVCGRTALCAFLSGCKMLVNSRVGLFSYPELRGDNDKANREILRELLRNKKQEFWESINWERMWVRV